MWKFLQFLFPVPPYIAAHEAGMKGLEELSKVRRFKLTGGSSDYYHLRVTHPTRPSVPPYETECNDIIEALQMTFAEANAFKAIWRSAAARLGNGKPGTTALYDAEKVVFFGGRMVVKASQENPNA